MTELTASEPGYRKAGYNLYVLRRHCTTRAKWRLEPGKAATSLPEHYQLDCDFGTAVITIFKTGDANDPIYLCDSHISEVKPIPKKCSEVRVIEARTPENSTSKASGDGDRVLEVADVKPIAPPPPKIEPVASKTVHEPEPAPAPKAKKIPRAAIERSPKAPARDLTYGNPDKALVDEAIWNLPADGQLAIVRRKIGEYTDKLEAVLKASTARIKVEDVIDKPFERAILEIIANKAISDAQKDAAIDQLGALQQSINRGLERELTPLEAHRIACTIGERANRGATASLGEELKPAYRAIYGSVRDAARAAVPHAHALEERLTNLYAAKSDLEIVPTVKAAHVSDGVSVAT